MATPHKRTASERALLKAISAVPYGPGIEAPALRAAVDSGGPLTPEVMTEYMNLLTAELRQVQADEEANERELGEIRAEISGARKLWKRIHGTEGTIAEVLGG